MSWTYTLSLCCIYTMCYFWNLLFLECAIFGMCSFWNVLFLEFVLFGMCPNLGTDLSFRMNMKIEESNWKFKNQTDTILNVYTQLQSQCLFSHFLSVWQVQILTVYAHWVRQRKNSHFTLLKTVKELDNFSYCQVTAQWMILCFLSKQTKVK